MSPFVSRAGAKLDHALAAFSIAVTGKICADLGCSTGGFTDCLLQRGAAKVFAVDTGYGVLDWKLRNDPRVVVMERTNAMHVRLPEPMDLITVDVGWTRQRHILPSARRLLAPGGSVVTLVKPHYEADPSLLRKGILPESSVDEILESVKAEAEQAGWIWMSSVRSPIRGAGGNVEVLARLGLPA
jgi:23S rRNA (cytidine1920-2'-O)/16S rRNA (cytidine1409-2'-O)-methyltransferase